MRLEVGMPKGDLDKTVIEICRRAGVSFVEIPRAYWWRSGSHELDAVFLKPREVAKYVAEGRLDVGFVGRDTLEELSLSGVVEPTAYAILADLRSSRVLGKPATWVLAVHKDRGPQTIEEMRLSSGLLSVATEMPRLAELQLSREGIRASVETSEGATEAKCPRYCDAIFDCVHSGATLVANGLHKVAELYDSTIVFIANKEKIEKYDKLHLSAEIAVSIEEAVRAF